MSTRYLVYNTACAATWCRGQKLNVFVGADTLRALHISYLFSVSACFCLTEYKQCCPRAKRIFLPVPFTRHHRSQKITAGVSQGRGSSFLLNPCFTFVRNLFFLFFFRDAPWFCQRSPFFVFALFQYCVFHLLTLTFHSRIFLFPLVCQVDPSGSPRTFHTDGKLFGLSFKENW